ncbi:MAG: HEAT repeat domain-containing protein [Waterburya sp.]
MIGERSVVIVTCALLSSITTCYSSLATESKISQPTNTSEQVLWQLNDGQNNRVIFSSNNNQAQAQKKFPQKSKELNNSSQQEQTEVISSRWLLVAFSLTSFLFLFVLWVLFQPDRQKLQQTTATNISEVDTHNVDAHNSVTKIDEKIDGKIEVFSEEEIIIPEPLPMIGMEYIDEPRLSYQETETEDLTSQQERLAAPVLRAESSQPEIMNKVTIVTGKTKEIDVVFELIQDLQQSDRLLRRKAIWKLTHTGDFRAIEPLVAIIPEADPVDKSLILDAITRIAQRSWQPISKALFISLEDENTEVKKNAIRDATALYKSIFPLTQCLFQMLGDNDLEVQQTAKWALQQFQQQISLAPSTQNHTTNRANVHKNSTAIADQSKSNH